MAYLANPDNASTVATLAGMKLLLEHASVAKATTQPAIVLSYGRFHKHRANISYLIAPDVKPRVSFNPQQSKIASPKEGLRGYAIWDARARGHLGCRNRSCLSDHRFSAPRL